MAVWMELEGKDAFPGDDAASFAIEDSEITDLKKVCVRFGFSGFVIRSGSAYFKSHSKQELIKCAIDEESCALFVAPDVGARNMTACQDPEILKPLGENLVKVQTLMAAEEEKDNDTDPVPQFEVADIEDATLWLQTAARAMRDYVDLFTARGVQGMDSDALARYQEKGREAARRLSVMLAANQDGFVNAARDSAIVEFSRVQESSAVRQCLEDLVAFFHTFGNSTWLGCMIADDDFASKNEKCIKIMKGLLHPLRLQFNKSAPCRALSLEANHATAPHEQTSNHEGNPCSSSLLEQLAAQAEAFASACRHDIRIRKEQAEHVGKKKSVLKTFADAVGEAQKSLDAFLLCRADEISETDSKILQKWIPRSEAHAAHRRLEQFRDDAMRESLRREMLAMYGPGVVGTRTPMSTDGEYEMPRC